MTKEELEKRIVEAKSRTRLRMWLMFAEASNTFNDALAASERRWK